jgi:hypothetical protein
MTLLGGCGRDGGGEAGSACISRASRTAAGPSSGPEDETVGRVQVVLFFNFRGSRTTGPSGSGFCKSGASGLQEDSRSLLT